MLMLYFEGAWDVKVISLCGFSCRTVFLRLVKFGSIACFTVRRIFMVLVGSFTPSKSV